MALIKLLLLIQIICFESLFGSKVRERFKNIPDHQFVWGTPCVS